MEERIPPHNLEAEQSVLGAALLSPDAMYDVLEITSADDFYDPNNKEIFSVIRLNSFSVITAFSKR